LQIRCAPHYLLAIARARVLVGVGVCCSCIWCTDRYAPQ
jgi:hypothetical protein